MFVNYFLNLIFLISFKFIYISFILGVNIFIGVIMGWFFWVVIILGEIFFFCINM